MAFRISRGIWQFKKEDGTYESKYKIATDGRLVTTDASGNELSTFGATAAWADITGKPSTFTPSAHTHTIANVTGLQAALDGKQASGSYAAASHTHTIANVTGLQAALDGKQASGSYAAASHAHAISDVTGLQSALDDKQVRGSYLTSESDTLATVTSRGNTTSGSINVNGNILLTGTATTTNQGRMIDFTGFDKEGTTDFSDRAYIQHTINAGGHSGSVLIISSQNDANDGIAFETNASSKLKHNSQNIATENWVSAQGYLTSIPAHTHTIANVTGLQSALDGKQAAGAYLTNTSSETISYVYRIHASDGTSPDNFGYNNRYQTFNYGVSSGITGPLMTFGGLGDAYPMQITGAYSGGGNAFAVRTRNGDTGTWNAWRTLITDGNIGSQSVNYANSAGAVAWGNVSGKPSTFTPSSHTHAISDVSGLQAALDDKQVRGSYAAASHTHTIAEVTGLQTALDGKQAAGSYAAASHTHDDRYYTESEVNTLLAGKLNTGAKAADSETVDGIDSSRIIYGDGGFGSTSWSDMNNTAQKSGFFFYNQPTGNPFNDWTHWINSMGNSWNPNYGFQLAHAFHSDRLAVRVVANGGFSSWRTVIDSGNIGSQSVNYANTAGSAPANGGNSNTVAGLAVHGGRNNEANKVVRTDGNGYIQAGWINTTSGDNGTTAIGRIYASQDGYIRYYTPSNFISVLGLITTGNISSQSVNYASSAGDTDRIDGWNFRNTGSNSGVNADTLNSNGITYYTAGVPNFSGNSTDGALYSQAYSDSWQHQIAADYRSGQIALRGKNNGTWQEWRTVLDSSNFSAWAQPAGSYAPLNGSLGTDFYTNAIYYDDWVRNHYNSNGMYWSQTGWHLYPINGAYFRIRSGNTATSGLRFMTGSTDRNYLHCNSSNEIGFLNASGSWALRVDNSGNTTATGDVTAFSDVRLKENIRPISGALDKVLSLQGVYYNRIDIEDKSTKIGFIAQDVKHIVPEVVQISSDELSGIEDRHSVDYGKLVALLTEAIKEQQKQIDELKTIINGSTK